MVFIPPFTSKSCSPFSNPLVTIPRALITIGIIITFMFHSFFQFPSKVEVLIILFTFFQFYSEVSRYSKVHNFANFFFNNTRSGRLAVIRWSVYMSKSQRSLCVSFSRTGTLWVAHISFVRMVSFKFLAHPPVDHLASPLVSSFILLLC